MKYSVGYSLIEREKFISAIRAYSNSIVEIYFAWPNMASGRLVYGSDNGCIDQQALDILENDLEHFKQMGIKLNLLLNGNCYGDQAISVQFQNHIYSILEHLENKIGGIDSVTTTSPFIAHIIKEHSSKIEIRASVNMRIGTVEGMKYLSDFFDGFCMQREYNRNFEQIKTLKEWADQNGKGLTLLVNSGCLNFCSNQTFHDNLVSHEAEISRQQNLSTFNPVMCWRYYSDEKNRLSILKDSNWVRPEDMQFYKDQFPVAKLATRLHSNPGKVISAYVKGRYEGNLLDLLEPGMSALFAPEIIDNPRFPAEWVDQLIKYRTSKDRDTFCPQVPYRVLV